MAFEQVWKRGVILSVRWACVEDLSGGTLGWVDGSGSLILLRSGSKMMRMRKEEKSCVGNSISIPNA